MEEYILGKNENAEEKIRKQVFVKAETDKTEVYIGEPILTTYKLYTRLRNDARITRRPPFNGFSVYEMNNPMANVTHTESVNGRTYDVYIIRQAQLFPLQEGDAQLEPVEIESKVKLVNGEALKNSDISEESLVNAYFYNTLPDEYTSSFTSLLQTAPVNIKVKPLPAEEKPEGFSGAVGRFEMRSSLSTERFLTGESATLSIQLEGSGNMPVINAPVINWPKGLETFEPRIKEEYDAGTVPLSGRKSFEYTFIPLNEGTMVIPSVSFSYFDPAQKKYFSIHTKADTITVGKGLHAYTPVTREAINESEKTELEKFYEMIGGKWTLVIIGAILFIFFVSRWNKKQRRKEIKRDSRRQQRKKEEWEELVQGKTTGPVISIEETVKETEEILPRSKKEIHETGRQFYNSLQTDIWVFAEKKTGVSMTERSKHKLSVTLTAVADTETIRELISIITLCETALYSPFDPEPDHQKIYDRAESVISKLA